jgi:adenylate cyclase
MNGEKRGRAKGSKPPASSRKRSVAPKNMPDVYQRALAEGATALNVVNQVLDRDLDEVGMGKLLEGLKSDGEDLFMDKLAEMLRQTSAVLVVSKRMGDSLSLDVLLPRMVDLISEFLSAERCTIFLHDPETDELFTKAGVGLAAEIRVPSNAGIVGAVFRSGEALIVADPYADPRFNQDVDHQTGFRTRNLVCVPLRHTRDGMTRVVGAVQVLNKKQGVFGPMDLKLLDALNSQAASAFMNAILYEEIKRARYQELEILEVATALSGELKLEPLLVKIMDTVTTLLGAERATLFLHDRKTRELWALAGKQLEEIRFPSHLGIAGHVFGTGETVNIENAYADERFNPDLDRRTGFKTRSILCMPVINRSGEVIGVTQVLNKKGGPFTAMDEKRLRAFSAQASVAMENAQLFSEVERIRSFNESILESITNGVLTVDRAGLITKANTAALRLLGRLGAPDVVLGQAAHTFFRDANAWIADRVAEVQETGVPSVTMDADVAFGAGMTSMNLAVLPFTDPKKAERGSLLMIEDITREKRMKATFSRYMNKQVADRLMEEGEDALGGRLQKATVLFSDLRSFTSLSERVGPQETVRLLNEYFSLMADIILDNEGLLDKYIGDAIMAVFGVPVLGPKDADVAVSAAIEMFRALRGFNARRVAAGQETIGMGIGINTDEVVSGNIGSMKRMDYTVIGDGVNLASRLEGANRLYGTQLLLSEFTRASLKDGYQMREIDRMRVRGKKQPVAVFEVFDHLPEESPARAPQFLSCYQKALSLYRRQEWTQAKEAFRAALEHHSGDTVSKLYDGRCDYFMKNPPGADWDGVWDMREKK